MSCVRWLCHPEDVLKPSVDCSDIHVSSILKSHVGTVGAYLKILFNKMSDVSPHQKKFNKHLRGMHTFYILTFKTAPELSGEH